MMKKLNPKLTIILSLLFILALGIPLGINLSCDDLGNSSCPDPGASCFLGIPDPNVFQETGNYCFINTDLGFCYVPIDQGGEVPCLDLGAECTTDDECCSGACIIIIDGPNFCGCDEDADCPAATPYCDTAGESPCFGDCLACDPYEEEPPANGCEEREFCFLDVEICEATCIQPR